MSIQITIRRDLSEKMSDSRISEMVEFITNEAIGSSNPHKLTVFAQAYQPKLGGAHKYQIDADLTFSNEDESAPEWSEGRTNQIKNFLMMNLQKVCKNKQKFTKFPWVILDENGKVVEDDCSEEGGLVNFDKAMTWEELEKEFNAEYLDMDDNQIEDSEVFSGIFERGPHIRIMLGAINKAIDTEGRVRNHCLLWGDPGAAKSGVIEAMKTMLPDNSYISLNVDSCTKAGFQKTFFNDLDKTGIPPIIFLEEIEKIDGDVVLRPLLSLMDTRAMIQKNTARFSSSKSAHVLFIATANDKQSFDLMMGGRRQSGGEIYPGAISSRFVHQLEVTRPTPYVMCKILKREIDANGGRLEYIDHIMDLAEELEITDPRRIISFLDGGERLLDGSYQKDMRRVMKVRRAQCTNS